MAAVFYGDVQVDVNSNAVKTAIFDSGSSYTYLIPSLYSAIVATVCLAYSVYIPLTPPHFHCVSLACYISRFVFFCYIDFECF